MANPIDPTDLTELWLVYWGANQAAHDADPNAHVQDRINDSILAVARAVCPEGYVAVPVWAARELLGSFDTDDKIDRYLNDGVFTQEEADALRVVLSLLPESEES